ncbi:hypothetical protein HETIRDRAFT_109172 [Heterobasidion irregulare TC 32-1]|uniref:Uncharacterized protein n=1 Tax=Heterobasidion irregulare (strain TC 32-1) TaxID=747525 RepID=W4KDU4_HETIT|nr:uncharacterized protein HETIRDRAFT_109172 [Heterobasidion irregulare TC 32-1]ETW83485.1 hypothetical protein HETIRDRAFT_109172 [Heterobasidion irregulare TC 32-1]
MSDGTSHTAAAQGAAHLVSRSHQHGLYSLGELRCIFSVANENQEESRTLSSRAFGRKVMGHVTSGYSAYSKLRGWLASSPEPTAALLGLQPRKL